MPIADCRHHSPHLPSCPAIAAYLAPERISTWSSVLPLRLVREAYAARMPTPQKSSKTPSPGRARRYLKAYLANIDKQHATGELKCVQDYGMDQGRRRRRTRRRRRRSAATLDSRAGHHNYMAYYALPKDSRGGRARSF